MVSRLKCDCGASSCTGSRYWRSVEACCAYRKASRRHYRPAARSRLLAPRSGKASASCRGRGAAHRHFARYDFDRYLGKLRQRSIRAIHQSRDFRSARPHIPGLQGGGQSSVRRWHRACLRGADSARSCAPSLARLGSEYLDLYLLHWPVPSAQFSGVVAAFEQLRAAGKIRAWGVSNFDVGQMEDLFRVPNGHRCATNQIPYSLNNRRIERDVLPWCKQHNLPVMAYSPLGGDNNLVLGDLTLAQAGAIRGCSAAAVALAWVIRSGSVIAIPESGSAAHVKENAVALSMALTPRDLQTLDAAFPGPLGAT